ncbi:MAG TPA: hypothetical protein VL068_13195 [Microthrixaceae bacterium]|nr:hypothetical protein [Microthrixaceae bacterium]
MTDPVEHRAGEFVSALPTPSEPTGRSDTYARVGLIVMVLGLAAAIIGVVLSQASNNPLDQSTQISLGIAGLAATCFGGVIYLRYSLGNLLRFWLLRVLHETRSDD